MAYRRLVDRGPVTVYWWPHLGRKVRLQVSSGVWVRLGKLEVFVRAGRHWWRLPWKRYDYSDD